jgi:VIT1/CCC1 family predicted Fe2+/Mn2+ transporter
MRARYADIHDPARRVYDFRAQFSPFYGAPGALYHGAGTLPQDYGMDPITIGLIVTGVSSLIATGVGAGVALSTAEKNREAAEKMQRLQVKEAKRQEKAAAAQTKREQDAVQALAAQQVAAASALSAPATGLATTGFSTTTLLLLGGVALAVLYAVKQHN